MAQPIWTTPAGTLGTFPAGFYNEIQLQASPVVPATSITYQLLGGSLPTGFSINSSGKIYGTVLLITTETEYNFSVRVTDNLGNIRDRTFSITITGSAIPSFVTPPGNILSTNDSVWVELPITYQNPDSSNPVSIRVQEGSLPPGLEINEEGLIRGYASPPILNVTVPEITTAATVTTSSTNAITCLSTTNFTAGRQVVFTGSIMFGGIEENITYYVKSVINATSFTITATQNGPEFILTDGSGFVTVTLPASTVGQPTIRTYTFGLLLDSPLGSDMSSYSITVINQNTPVSQGGPGYPSNSRIPAIYNTRPPRYNLATDPYYGYYVLPANTDTTYPPTTPAFMGTFESSNYFSFKIIGNDFDGDELTYIFAGLPPGLTGNILTGWITGTPVLSSEGINQYGFSVSVYKTINPAVATPFFNFSYNLSNGITDTISWITSSNLGSIFNGTISTKNVKAIAEVDLQYKIVSGSLPPNLTLLSNGEITGYVADQPTNVLLQQNSTTDFVFTIQAYSPTYPIIKSDKTFTLSVIQEFGQPTDTLYIKAAPSFHDRDLLNSLLTDDTIIPYDSLYRPYDVYFGKATDVIYEHAYGIYASDIDEYLAAVTQNHYWRNIILGELKTAVAKNDNGEIIYEVVYSQVIDKLVNLKGVSVSQSIYWPRPINLNLGPWYTSVTNIYTSYAQAVTQNYYTSLSPGTVRTLYPNSLLNMRNRVGQVLGQEYDSRLLPLWMTSTQSNGGTLGYTPAWVICYTKPGLSETIKNNIETMWTTSDGTKLTLNEINFQIDRFSVNKTLTYNYDKSTTPPAWTGLPSASPTPDPLDSKDFYVLFPRKTILPNQV